MLTYEYISISAACRKLGLNISTVHGRRYRGWTLKDAFKLREDEEAEYVDKRGHKYENIYFVEFIYNNVNYDIETDGINIVELEMFLKSIIK